MPQKQRERELFVSERPIRSDYGRVDGRERIYARRRIATITVLFFIIAGSLYGFMRHRSLSPAYIPTIKTEGVYKQKPSDPGGIDIPHQDVEVYNKMENKSPPEPGVEHLLPPPEVPQDVPHGVAPQVPPQKIDIPPPPSPASLPATSVVEPAPVPLTAPASAPIQDVQKSDAILGQTVQKQIATTVTAPAAATSPVIATEAPTSLAPDTPAKAPQTIDDILKDTQALANKSSKSVTAGPTTIQLASSADQAKAQSMMENLQQKYAAELNGATLQLERADLGSRGTFYRIQSRNLTEDSANRICSALKQKNAGCILVRK